MIYIYHTNGDLAHFFDFVSCFGQSFTDPRSDSEFVGSYYNLLATFELR
jgi:hypothetical protein